MAPVELTDEQIKSLILNYLLRRKCWGKKYLPRQTLIRHLGHDVLGDGKEVSRCLDELIKDRWINPYKKGKTVHLNVSYNKEIVEHISQYDQND